MRFADDPRVWQAFFANFLLTMSMMNTSFDSSVPGVDPLVCFRLQLRSWVHYDGINRPFRGEVMVVSASDKFLQLGTRDEDKGFSLSVDAAQTLETSPTNTPGFPPQSDPAGK